MVTATTTVDTNYYIIEGLIPLNDDWGPPIVVLRLPVGVEGIWGSIIVNT